MSENYDLLLNEYNTIKNKFLDFYKNITDEFISKLLFTLNCLNELFVINTILKGENIYLSFNGGKDCLAVYLILKYFYYCKEFEIDRGLKSSFKRFCEKHKTFKIKEKVILIYFINENNFESEEDYVIKFAQEEGLKVIYIVSDYINGLKFLKYYYNLKIIFMGTRKDDIKYNSYNENLVFPSTAPYPDFLRFYPVFNWNFEDVWRLILSTGIEYLVLYDLGYSSIGRKNNSKINEYLKLNENLILPAWCLNYLISERNFRM